MGWQILMQIMETRPIQFYPIDGLKIDRMLEPVSSGTNRGALAWLIRRSIFGISTQLGLIYPIILDEMAVHDGVDTCETR